MVALAFVILLVLGFATALAAASSASASGSWNWAAYNLSSEANGLQSTGAPAMIADPNGYTQDEVTNSPSGHTIIWTGDGGTGGRATFDITTMGNGPVSTGSPSVLYEPANDDMLTLIDSTGGDLIAYDRSPSGGFTAYNITQAVSGGTTISGNPSGAGESSRVLDVAADSAGGDLVVYSLATNGDWSEANVSSSTGQTITGDPVALSDPSGSVDIFADSANGDLVEFNDATGSWQSVNLTTSTGGQTITGDPTVVNDRGDIDVFSEAPGGDLVEWRRGAGSQAWADADLTSETSGPSIDGQPGVVVEPGGTIDVFAQGGGQHLIWYAYPGGPWSATDLTASAGAPLIESAPGAAISASTGNLVVAATSPAGDLVEVERTAATATSSGTTSSATTTTVATQTVQSTPPPAPGAKQQVKVKVLTDWVWTKTASELRWIKLGAVTKTEGLALICTGTGRRHTTGCPYRERRASGRAAIRELVARTARTRYRVGDVLALTVSETGLKSEHAAFRIRSGRAPKVTG